MTNYRLHVVARDVAEVVGNAAGLIVDHVMAGWHVTVELAVGEGIRPLEILGADVVDGITDFADDRWMLAIGADGYARAGGIDELLARCTDVLVWGTAPRPQETYRHRLSGAGRAFKAAALGAAGITDVDVVETEVFASRVAGHVSLRA